MIKKAEIACKKSGQATTNHFSEFTEKAKIGSGATRDLKSWKLSRYACYLIIQNADPNKEIVALGPSRQGSRSFLLSILRIRKGLSLGRRSLSIIRSFLARRGELEFMIMRLFTILGIKGFMGSKRKKL